jgi:hypothetical protein
MPGFLVFATLTCLWQDAEPDSLTLLMALFVIDNGIGMPW